MSDELINSVNGIDLFVGKQLRIGRQKLGITQSYLADRLGITFQQIQKYEKGMNRISASRLYDAASILNLPIRGFFPHDGDMADSTQKPSKEIDEIVAIYNSIKNPRFRKELLKLMKAISEDTYTKG